MAKTNEKKTGGIQVRATRRGLYGDMLRERGDVFTVKSKADMGSWMEVIGEQSTAPASDEE